MATEPALEPWVRLKEILDSGQPEAMKAFLDSLPPGETARAISRLADEEQARVLTLLGPEESADLVQELSGTQAADIIEELPPAQAAAIVEEMRSDQQADLLGDLPDDDAAAILHEMPPEKASDARLLLQYPPNSAGGMMIREFLAYADDLKVADVLDDLRKHAERYSDYEVQYAFIVAGDGALVGVLRLRDLLLSRPDAPVRSVMVADPFHFKVDASLEEMQRFFEEHGFLGAPVVDEAGRLLGVARRTEVQQVAKEMADQTLLKFSGLGEDEFRTMPLVTRSTRRLVWLSINIVLNVISASVIMFYQDTLSAAIALAVFLPIISDMSGNAGCQAAAVSLRELSLGLVKPYELLRVLFKEFSLGLIIGPVIGGLLAGLALVWKGNPYLGLVVGGAMTLNTLVAVTFGGLIPLVLKSLKLDPALASTPILTTITDMCGFFFALSFASAVLPKLTAA